MSEFLTRDRLALAMVEKFNVSSADADLAVQAFFSTVSNTVNNGEDVKFPNFGTFYSQKVDRTRAVMDFKTGQLSHKHFAGTAFKFKASKNLKDV